MWHRTFLVRDGEIMKEMLEILSGVPHGSVLGPPLDIIDTFDMSCFLHCSISAFADNTKIFKNPLLNFGHLQNDL